MDDKIKERCKTCEKQCMQEDLDRLRGVEMLSSQPRWIEKLLRSYREVRSFLDWSTYLSRGVKIAIRNSLRVWQIAKCRGGVKEVLRLLKNNFSRKKKHRYECNQACNSTNDPINILDSQNHLSTKILSTKISKTLSHTNKSNQFYISKTSQDSLVNIH